jgi:GT2 family glycosyltransferase/alpha-tubulin suppressor-like RCC1 family protein
MTADRTNPPDLSVLVVSWNTLDLTLECIRHVHEARGDLAVEVLVVDNASADGTAAAIRERYPDVVVVENEANEGFPRANNQALAMARGRHVLYLNSDALVDPDTLERCVAALDRDPALGVVGCRLEYPDGRIQYECARRDYRLGHMAAEFFYLHQLFPAHPVFAAHLMGDWDHRDSRDVEAISGAFMMARRQVALDVAGLPEDVFMYHEDLSFCLRVRRAGWRIRYLADVRAVHLSGQSSKRNPARLYLLEPRALTLLIREKQGAAAAGAARALWGVRALFRLAIALPASVLPVRGLRARYPRLFHPQRHALQLLWSVSPRLVERMVPTAGSADRPAPRRAALLPLLLVLLAGVTACGGDPADPFDEEEGVVTLFSDLAAGAHHTCAVTQGRLYCWGADDFAQSSGDLERADRSGGAPPMRVALPELALEVTAGQRHTCALLLGGQAYCWGWNQLGQTGPGSLGGTRAPGPVQGGHDFSAIAAGWNHTCGIAGTRTHCWGTGGQGQLGDGERQDRSTPVAVAGDLAFVQVTAGGYHSCGLTAQGQAYCWGANHMGQLGTGTTAASAVPAPVAGDDRFTRLAAGFEHSCGVLVGGGLKCWGSNIHGELGNSGIEATGLPGSLTPSPVVRVGGIVQVDAGAHFTCGSLSNGDTWCWGRGSEGQLAAGFPRDHAVPQQIAGLAGPVRGGGFLSLARLALGTRHACGLTAAGTMFCWGTGPSGELGHPEITYTNIPVRVRGQ